jgi:hypothetical protein
VRGHTPFGECTTPALTGVVELDPHTGMCHTGAVPVLPPAARESDSTRKPRPMTFMQTWELLSYVVTVVGLPLAIWVFMYEQRKERDNEDEEVYQLLSDAYHDFLKLVLANPDLKLRSQPPTPNLTEEQQERMLVIFEMLIALFERAYLTAYDDRMSVKQQRRWHSWEDFMREWCRRDDFRVLLPRLLQGEDQDFVFYIQQLAQEENSAKP